jgi:hypothetical protein
MAAGLMLATGCIAVPFFLRVLIGLCGEYRTVRICYLARVQPEAAEISVIEPITEEWRIAA